MELDEKASDQLVDDAVAGAEDAFAQRGIQLTESQLFSLGDYLYALLRKHIEKKE